MTHDTSHLTGDTRHMTKKKLKSNNNSDSLVVVIPAAHFESFHLILTPFSCTHTEMPENQSKLSIAE